MQDLKGRMKQRKWRNIAVITGGMVALSTLTFNCAPSMFLAMTSSGTSSSSSSVDQFSQVGRSPIALLNVNEAFNSMANVAGLTNNIPAAMRAEFNLRAGALADNPLVTNVNAPLQLATTAIAGEACNAIIAQEMGQTADQRRFFGGVDFTKGPAQQSASAIQGALGALAQAFWNRAPTGDEMAQLQQFAADLPESAAATQTQAIALGACTAMLASFDAITY